MGILDELLGGVLGDDSGQAGGQRSAQSPAAAGGGMGGIAMALLPVVLSMLSGRGSPGQGGGGLGDIISSLTGGGARPSGGGLDDAIGGMLGRTASGGGGALGGLLEQMQKAGFGDQARSWVGRGQNMPIPPEALDQIFGEHGIGEIARHAGLTPRQTSEGLSALLPEVVDRVTPDGQVPDLDQLTMSVDNLRRRLGT